MLWAILQDFPHRQFPLEKRAVDLQREVVFQGHNSPRKVAGEWSSYLPRTRRACRALFGMQHEKIQLLLDY